MVINHKNGVKTDNRLVNLEVVTSGQNNPCPTLRAMTLPHADHPDYREEWRP